MPPPLQVGHPPSPSSCPPELAYQRVAHRMPMLLSLLFPIFSLSTRSPGPVSAQHFLQAAGRGNLPHVRLILSELLFLFGGRISRLCARCWQGHPRCRTAPPAWSCWWHVAELLHRTVRAVQERSRSAHEHRQALCRSTVACDQPGRAGDAEQQRERPCPHRGA